MEDSGDEFHEEFHFDDEPRCDSIPVKQNFGLNLHLLAETLSNGKSTIERLKDANVFVILGKAGMFINSYHSTYS